MSALISPSHTSHSTHSFFSEVSSVNELYSQQENISVSEKRLRISENIINRMKGINKITKGALLVLGLNFLYNVGYSYFPGQAFIGLTMTGILWEYKRIFQKIFGEDIVDIKIMEQEGTLNKVDQRSDNYPENGKIIKISKNFIERIIRIDGITKIALCILGLNILYNIECIYLGEALIRSIIWVILRKYRGEFQKIIDGDDVMVVSRDEELWSEVESATNNINNLDFKKDYFDCILSGCAFSPPPSGHSLPPFKNYLETCAIGNQEDDNMSCQDFWQE